MEMIEQKIAEQIDIVVYSEMIYLEQKNYDDTPEHMKDIIQIEKSSIPALIEVLQKYIEPCQP